MLSGTALPTAAPVARLPRWFFYLLIAMGALLVSLCFYCPHYWLWNLTEYRNIPQNYRVLDTLAQTLDPSFTSFAGGNEVLRWRLLLPTLFHTLHIPWPLLLALPYAGCVGLLYMTARMVHTATGSWAGATWAALLVGSTSPILVSTDFLLYFDSLLACTVLGVVLLQRPMGLWVVASLAPWLDERFILALPLVLWARWASQRDISWRYFIRPVALGVAPYLALRLAALAYGTDYTGGFIHNILQFHHSVPGLLLGFWDTFRWGWVALIFAVGTYSWAVRTTYRTAVLMGSFAIVAATLGLLSIIAGDYTRSIGLALPLLLLGILAIYRHCPRVWATVLIAGLAIANYATPAAHSWRAFRIPTQHILLQLAVAQQIYSLPPPPTQP